VLTQQRGLEFKPTVEIYNAVFKYLERTNRFTSPCNTPIQYHDFLCSVSSLFNKFFVVI